MFPTVDALCPGFCALAECAPEECDPGETHEIVCDGAGEIDEVEDHLPGGHGCGAEEGGEGAEGVQQEEAFAHEGEGGDAEGQPAAVGAEPAGGGRREGEGGEGEGEDVEVCLECILDAFLRGSVTAAGKNKLTRNLSLPLLLSMSFAMTCTARIGFPVAVTARLRRYSPPSSDAAPSAGGELFSPISRHDASSPAAEPMLRLISSLAPAWCLWRGVDQGFDAADELESGGDGRCDIGIIIIKMSKQQQQQQNAS